MPSRWPASSQYLEVPEKKSGPLGGRNLFSAPPNPPDETSRFARTMISLTLAELSKIQTSLAAHRNGNSSIQRYLKGIPAISTKLSGAACMAQ